MTILHDGALSKEDQKGTVEAAMRCFGETKRALAALGVLNLFPTEALVQIHVPVTCEEKNYGAVEDGKHGS